jgi:purine-cytosine permease-like protein
MSTKLRFGKRSLTLPGNPAVRIGLGILLILCGIVGFLPILGFWMVPLGLLILSVDSPVVRRFRRRTEVYWGRKYQRWKASRAAKSSGVGEA